MILCDLSVVYVYYVHRVRSGESSIPTIYRRGPPPEPVPRACKRPSRMVKRGGVGSNGRLLRRERERDAFPSSGDVSDAEKTFGKFVKICKFSLIIADIKSDCYMRIAQLSPYTTYRSSTLPAPARISTTFASRAAGPTSPRPTWSSSSSTTCFWYSASRHHQRLSGPVSLLSSYFYAGGELRHQLCGVLRRAQDLSAQPASGGELRRPGRRW